MPLGPRLRRHARRTAKMGRKLAKTAPLEWQAFARSRPIDPDLVVYESFAGRGMLCNPEAIFRALLSDPTQGHRRHVWVLDDPKAHPAVVREFANEPRVRFVRYRSPRYHRVLATAGVLVNNATFPSTFNKRPGQVYLNTWHGTPLKKMGYDEAGGAVGSRNVVRNFMMADYLLSTSPFMSEVMYEQAYRLANVGPGRLIEEGYPRTDRQELDLTGRANVLSRMRKAGVDVPDGCTIVLYAPTWKGESFHRPINDARSLAATVSELESLLPEGHRVLLRAHQQVSSFVGAEPRLAGRLVPDDLPTNEVLGVTDLLVTDYSSVFFDFLSTGRPVVFYAPDAQDYEQYRGWYLGLDELPGPVVSHVHDLAKILVAAGTGGADDPSCSHRYLYDRARERFAPWDDGNATQRVLDVLLNRSAEGRRVRETARDGRPTVLLYLGGMKSNGITSSALNLVRNLDHERVDVSVMFNHSEHPERRANIALIDERARQLVRIGGVKISKRDYLRRRKLFTGRTDELSRRDVIRMDEVLVDEWRRTVGDASFDHVVDFSGYSPVWSYLVSSAPAGSRSIWLHNDLAADQRREIAGHSPHHRNLAGVFGSYHRFDHLVSVSEALCRINGENLAQYAPPEKFTSARNTIDHERILSRSAEPPAEGTVLPTDGPTFVTVGRLSPEKNHRRLLEAFAILAADEPGARLVIIGDGPLRPALELIAQSAGVADRVVFTGLQENPWAIMAQCTCFVLSSDYEGQPMVILEARTLGLPIVTTRFASVSSAVGTAEGLIVEQSVEALAQGLATAAKGEVPQEAFDPVAYNEAVIAEFSRAVGLPIR